MVRFLMCLMTYKINVKLPVIKIEACVIGSNTPWGVAVVSRKKNYFLNNADSNNFKNWWDFLNKVIIHFSWL